MITTPTKDMYRDRIENTKAPSEAASNLRDIMLAYHDFQHTTDLRIPQDALNSLAAWQSERLKQTHADLYHSKDYIHGLNFLLSDLYSPQDFSARDRDLERIFPKLVKLLPDAILGTVSLLVELNLLTQKLDHQLGYMIFKHVQHDAIDEHIYCTAYRQCDNHPQRQYQLNLISEVGDMLNRYARSSMIHFSLKLSDKPAEMAGLGALHNFIKRGFSAFHTMADVNGLMTTVVTREQTILDNIYNQVDRPFDLAHLTTNKPTQEN